MKTKTARYVGFDLGGDHHEVRVCDETGKEVHGFVMPRGRSGWERLRQEVESTAPEGAGVAYLVEAAQNFWPEVVHPLKAAGEEVYLLCPTKCSDLRRFYRRHTKTDPIDALATARVGLNDPGLQPAWVGTSEQESLKRLCRLSWKLSQEIRNRKRRFSTLVEMVYPGIKRVWKNRYCASARLFYRRYLDPSRARRIGRKRLGEMLRRRAWGKFSAEAEETLWAVIQNAPELRFGYDDLQLEVRCELDLLDSLEKHVEELKERIDELYCEVDRERLLESVPGIGCYLAACFTSVIGDIERWRNADCLVAASGLIPRKKASSGREVANQQLTKQGNPQFRCWLYVAAELVRHYDPELQAFFLRLRRRGLHHKAAICAVATKLLRRIYAVLRDRVEYRRVAEERIQNREKLVRTSVSEVAQALLKDEADSASRNEEYAAQPAVATLARERSPGVRKLPVRGSAKKRLPEKPQESNLGSNRCPS
jgi:transposase